MPSRTSVKSLTFAGTGGRSDAARANQAARRIQRTLRSRSQNKSVKRIQGQQYKPRIVKNTDSIKVLAKQVRSLQRSQLGPLQSTKEGVNIDLGATPFSSRRPLLFCANDFTDPGHVRAGVYHSVDNSLAPDTVNIGANRFAHHRYPGTGQGIGSDDTNYWFKEDDNRCSSEMYLPVSSSIKMLFSIDMNTADIPKTYRIDVIRQKKMMHSNSDRKLQLPESLEGLGNMISHDMLNRNMFNKEFFEVQQTKFITIEPRADATAARTKYYKEVDLFIPFKHQVLKPDVNAHGSTNDHPAFYKNTTPTKLVWVLISTDHDSQFIGDYAHTLQIHRLNRWRDQGDLH